MNDYDIKSHHVRQFTFHSFVQFVIHLDGLAVTEDQSHDPAESMLDSLVKLPELVVECDRRLCVIRSSWCFVCSNMPLRSLLVYCHE